MLPFSSFECQTANKTLESMDASEATRIVFARIQTLDPANAAKIMGFLLLQDHGEKEMIRLAFGPESFIHSLVLTARNELGLSPAPPPSSAPVSPSNGVSPFALNRQNSVGGRPLPPSPLAVVSSPFSRSNAGDELRGSEELVNPKNGEFYGVSGDLLDEYSHHESLYADCWGMNGNHRRSCSASGYSDLAGSLVDDGGSGGFGWKPCMYFARGFCKNGSGCRFIHGLLDESASAGSKIDAAAAMEQQCQELLLRSNSPRIGVPRSAAQLMPSGYPFSPIGSPSGSANSFNYLLQQNENQRAEAMAALMFRGDETHKFMARARFDKDDFNPASRQIYLTFPADSTFSEEDVSNYFSIYGPVEDVRIPYQQKRMFGFVTFMYPETVKLILAKGNPHFVCHARVLVKPYKEKGKVPDKFRKQQLQGDFPVCTSPTGLSLDSRADPYDLQHFGARMLYNNGSSQEHLLRRKLEEQQAAELQKAIELQSRRFMGLQLLDLKHRMSSAPTFVNTHTIPTADEKNNNCSYSDCIPVSSPQEKSCHEFLVNPQADKKESNVEGNTKNDSEFQESDEHNLPDSPFASPTKKSIVVGPFSNVEVDIATSNATATPNITSNSGNNNDHLISPTFLPPSSAINMTPFNSCFFQMPRFSSNHGAIGM